MTWSRTVQTPMQVSAWTINTVDGEDRIQIGVGGNFALLTQEEAASLGGYLMGSTNNESPKAGDPQ